MLQCSCFGLRKVQTLFILGEKNVTINIPNAQQVRKGQNPLNISLADRFDIIRNQTVLFLCVHCSVKIEARLILYSTIITPGLHTDNAYHMKHIFKC